MLPVDGVCLDRAADTRLTTGSPEAAENGRRTFTVEAKRLGACAAGQRGGDTITDQKVVDLFTAAPKTN